MSQALLLGDAINHAYQSGYDEDALRFVARLQREALDPSERAAFTEAVEMCGLILGDDDNG